MIPVSIGLRDFLTYAATEGGEPVLFDFEGAKIWSISGANGTGKTSIFDAITYALFGEHRGGSQNDRRLVRKGADSMEVIFSFWHKGQLWKIRRTLHVKQKRDGTLKNEKAVGVSCWDDQVAGWVPVPDINGPKDMKRWVDDTLDLHSEVFRSTVLLQQGGADRILTVEPAIRFSIFADLVDLSAYSALEELAAERRRASTAELKSLQIRLDSLEEVQPSDVSAAREEQEAAATALQVANSLVTDETITLENARRLEQLQIGLKKATKEREAAAGLLKRRSDVHADADRLTELRTTVSSLTEASEHLKQAQRAEENANTFRGEASAMNLGYLDGNAKSASAEASRQKLELRELEAADQDFRTWLPRLKERNSARTSHAAAACEAETAGDPAAIRKEIEDLEVEKQKSSVKIGELEERQRELIHTIAAHNATAAHTMAEIGAG